MSWSWSDFDHFRTISFGKSVSFAVVKRFFCLLFPFQSTCASYRNWRWIKKEMDESCKFESHASMSSICFYSEHDYTVQFCRKMVAGQILRDYLVLSHGFCNDRHISLGIYWSPNAAGRALPGTAGRGKPSRSHVKMLAQGNLAVDEVGGWVPDWGMNGGYIYGT